MSKAKIPSLIGRGFGIAAVVAVKPDRIIGGGPYRGVRSGADGRAVPVGRAVGRIGAVAKPALAYNECKVVQPHVLFRVVRELAYPYNAGRLLAEGEFRHRRSAFRNELVEYDGAAVAVSNKDVIALHRAVRGERRYRGAECSPFGDEKSYKSLVAHWSRDVKNSRIAFVERHGDVSFAGDGPIAGNAARKIPLRGIGEDRICHREAARERAVH